MILDIVTDLYKRGYSEITMVAGSDRVREFDTILKKYNGVKSVMVYMTLIVYL